MPAASLPENELTRIDALKRLNVLDTDPESEFDALVKAASLVCDVPISLISLVDDKRQWFKANVGLPGVKETSRDFAFCAYAIHGDGFFEINDASQDDRFSDNPLVLSDPNIRFYAGAIIKLSDGSNIGTLCVIDTKPKHLNEKERNILMQLAIAASKAIERRRISKIQQSLNLELLLFIEQAPAAIAAFDTEMNYLACSRRWLEDYNLLDQEIIGRNHYEIFPNIPENWKSAYQRCLAGATEKSDEDCFVYQDNLIWNRWEIRPWFKSEQLIGGIIAYTENITKRKLHEQELLVLNQQLWKQSNFDQLTELPNRFYMTDFLNEKIQEAINTNIQVALILLDLDKFKVVNDAYGHHIGDELLKQVSKRLLHCVRDTDIVARLGGDEFTVILLNMNKKHSTIEKIIQNIINSIAEPINIFDKEIRITTSLGVAIAPKDATSSHDLMKMADQAMYFAKRKGGSCHAYFSESMAVDAEERLILTNDLRKAIKNNELVIYYQPVVNIITGEIEKAEALLRWHHPTKGIISPLNFIPIAEESGLIIDIGNWVLLNSINFVKYLRENYHPNFEISINKSPIQFANNRNLNKDLFTSLIEEKAQVAGIVIEITEGLLLDESAEVKSKLNKLRDAGFKLAIDDFGTGYSALAYLNKFKIDYLKIDRSFIKEIETSLSMQVLVEAIINMSHKLGIKVVAEGVETEGQCRVVTLAGSDLGQGYLWAKPMQMNEFEDLLKKCQNQKALPNPI